MPKKLVILSNRIGLDFSGGSDATIHLIEQLAPQFEEIIAISNELNATPFAKKLKHLPAANVLEMREQLKSCSRNNTVFYGDFYDSIAFVEEKIPFHFTYHDNWPEQKDLNAKNLKSASFFIKNYQRIFKNAEHVFSVSHRKTAFIRPHTSKVTVVRNGISLPITKIKPKPFTTGDCLKIIMLGNICERKYLKGLPLFELIQNSQLPMQIDIFGHDEDDALSQRLRQFPFIHLKGFSKQLTFENYHLLLSTSYMENLPISMVEALQNHTPVLSFDIGGIREIVTEKTGCLAPPYAVEILFNALVTIYQQKLKFDFSKLDLDDFNWQKSAQKMFQIMQNKNQ